MSCSELSLNKKIGFWTSELIQNPDRASFLENGYRLSQKSRSAEVLASSSFVLDATQIGHQENSPDFLRR